MALRHVEGPEKEYLTFNEVQAALRCSRSHLMDLINDGQFPTGIRLGGSKKLVWHWLDVVAFVHLSSRLHTPVTPAPRKTKTARKSPEVSSSEESE